MSEIKFAIVVLALLILLTLSVNQGAKNAYMLGCARGAVQTCQYRHTGCDQPFDIVMAAVEACKGELK